MPSTGLEVQIMCVDEVKCQIKKTEFHSKCASCYSLAKTGRKWLWEEEAESASSAQLEDEQSQRARALGGGCEGQAWLSRWLPLSLVISIEHLSLLLQLVPVLNIFFRWTISTCRKRCPLDSWRLKTCLQVQNISYQNFCKQSDFLQSSCLQGGEQNIG